MASKVTEKSKISINLEMALTEANKSVSRNKNFICSPLGIHLMLSILANGSTGETRNQIYNYLGSKNLKEINQKASKVMEIIYPAINGSSECPVVSFVNGAWVNLHSTFLKSAFQKLLQSTYKADAKALDFQNKEEVCKEINKWVSDATQGTITELLSPHVLQEDTIFILGNALFFKAAWENPYGGGVGPVPNLFSFVADHPFLFTIREETSQVTFFIGTVLNPILP